MELWSPPLQTQNITLRLSTSFSPTSAPSASSLATAVSWPLQAASMRGAVHLCIISLNLRIQPPPIPPEPVDGDHVPVERRLVDGLHLLSSCLLVVKSEVSSGGIADERSRRPAASAAAGCWRSEYHTAHGPCVALSMHHIDLDAPLAACHSPAASWLLLLCSRTPTLADQSLTAP